MNHDDLGPDQRTDPMPAQTPTGIGGWLAFLVVGLAILGPFSGAGRIFLYFSAAEDQAPLLALMPEWTTFKVVTWIVYAVFAAIGIRAGWVLAHRRTPAVVRHAMAALWIVGPVCAITLDVIVPLVTLGSTVFTAAMVMDIAAGLVRSVAIAALWTVYLHQSKRVRATYGYRVEEQDNATIA
jgi:Protein of unknown function (DUF2569)